MKIPLVLIPAHNESRTIAGVVKIALKYLPVLVVDDGSSDETARIAQSAGAEIIRQEPNQGKGAALLNGFRYALNNKYPAVITLDGDGQHDPEEIPSFLAAWKERPAGLIIGRRNFSKMPFIRRLANTLGRWLFSLSVGQSIADNQSGYRLIGCELMESMLGNSEPGFEFEVDMIALALKHKIRIGWVPIRTIYLDESSHIKPIRHLIQFLRICLKARRTVKQT